MSRRQRGVVLTDRGKQRLEAAIAAAQDQEKYGAHFTQSELAERSQLSGKTIKKICEQTSATDDRSVRALFGAFGLELEPADYGQAEPALSPASPESTTSRQSSTAKIDWGEKPDTAFFFGRTAELATLNHWVQGDQCRLITLLGMGGIGKTSLAAKLANQVYDRFDYVIWRSLREAPPLDEILVRLIQFLSDQQETEINLPTRLGERIIRLLHYLREHRCLVVLDNLESILQAETSGHYRDGYESYGELIQRIGSTEHQSCLLLTSRECPRELAPLAGDLMPVRLWSVGSVDTEAGREILKTKGLALDEADDQGQELIRRCSGNPQALHLVATAIQREFLGDVDDFLQEQVTTVEDVRSLLDQHLSRLAPLERSVLFWLAINREPVGLDELMEDLLPPVTKQEVRGALRGLSDRSLLESVGKHFTLQNVIMEFVTGQLVKRFLRELEHQDFDLFHSHALIKATAKYYVRETQIRLILKPLKQKIPDSIIDDLSVLYTIRQNPKFHSGYAAGNFLNFLSYSNSNLSGCDFSGLTIMQAYLCKHEVFKEINLHSSKILKSSFINPFGAFLSLALSPDGQLLAAGNSDANVYILRIFDKQILANYQGHTSWVRTVAFSPDGNLLASGSEDRTIRLWNVRTGECIAVLNGHTDRVWAASFSHCGSLLATSSDDETVRIWDMATHQCLHVLRGHTNWVRAVAFSPKKKIIATGSDDRTIRLWSLETVQCIHVFTQDSWIRSLAFSPNGEVLASGSTDGKISLFDIRNLKTISLFKCHENWIRAVEFSPDGCVIASGGDDKIVRLRDLKKVTAYASLRDIQIGSGLWLLVLMEAFWPLPAMTKLLGFGI